MGGCCSSLVERRPKRHRVKWKPGSDQMKYGAVVPLIAKQNSRDLGFVSGFREAYKLESHLGQGTFGRTLVATNLASGLQAAVKMIEKKKIQLPISISDVSREVEIMKKLSGNENVVEFYEAFEDDDYVYIVMELCRGGELLNWILSKKNAKYTEKDAAKLVWQMLNMAAYCHLHGIVHRDLKPENFVFKSDGGDDLVLKVIDFGLSDYIRQGKSFNDVVGSAYYLAPEVLKRRSGPESDVWSIGVITYILLSGRKPFQAKTENSLFQKILVDEPDFAEEPWPSISPSAKDFVRKLLTKDPYARPTAAKALSHPWVRGEAALDIPLDISVLSSMRQFVKCNELRKIALKALASVLDDEDVANLRDQFNTIDQNKDGKISLREIYEALAQDKSWSMRESKVYDVLCAMDMNKDGLVDFDEFVAAALQIRHLERVSISSWHVYCHAAFAKLDVDKDGYITPEELKPYMSRSNSAVSLIDEADIDKDGRLNFLEFKTLLCKT